MVVVRRGFQRSSLWLALEVEDEVVVGVRMT